MTTLTTTTTNEITANEIQMGINHSKQVIAEWNADVEDNEPVATEADVLAAQERVIKMFAEINAMTEQKVAKPVGRKMSSVEASMPAWMLTGRTTNGTFAGRGTEPAVEKTAEPVWNDEFDEPATAPGELTQETLALCEADTTPLNLDAPLALEQPPVWMQSENATEAEPGPVIEPMPLKPVRPEQKAYFVTWAASMTNDKKRYGLLCRKSDGLAVDCSCGDRVHRGRKQGRACKHQLAHNAMIIPATKKMAKKAA